VRENDNLFVHDAFTLWVSGQMLTDAIKAGGLTAGATPQRPNWCQGLRSLKGDTLGGVTSPLTFTAGKAHTIDCWFTAGIQNGTATVENNVQSTCQNGTGPTSERVE
jgi:hypothetical protein